ncbi:MAG: type IV pilus secretin PilQ [Pseudomonadota bacterium]
MKSKIFSRWLCCFLVLLVAVSILPGCFSIFKKKSDKPDRYEKWRVMAEDSRGNTPSPRKYEKDIDVKRDGRSVILEDRVIGEGKPPSEDSEAQMTLPTVKVSMKMHEVPVAILLRTLARAADVNIMINETVTGNAKINISELPWDQAFLGLINTYGLTYTYKNGILRVITVEDLNKDIALMEAMQKFEKSKKEHNIAMLSMNAEAEKLEPLVTRIVKVDYTDIAALKENLQQYLLADIKDIKKNTGKDKDLKSSDKPEIRGSILLDKSSSSLIIQATRSDIDKLMPIIKELDRPADQILIEAHIVEANSDTARELGIQWGGLGLNHEGGYNNWIGGSPGTIDTSLVVSSDNATETVPAGTPITHLPAINNIVNFPTESYADGKGLTLGFLYENIGKNMLYGQLMALQNDGLLNILSKPSITTMDNRVATIESGKEVPFQTVDNGEVKIEWKKAVINLEVTPHVIDGKLLRLEINTHKDELDWTNTVAGNPTIITKNAKTEVTLYDGQTTVIGGLNKEKTSESDAGIPWLKDIKGLGWLFGSSSDSSEMEELLIFITPHILKEKAAETDANNG